MVLQANIRFSEECTGTIFKTQAALSFLTLLPMHLMYCFTSAVAADISGFVLLVVKFIIQKKIYYSYSIFNFSGVGGHVTREITVATRPAK